MSDKQYGDYFPSSQYDGLKNTHSTLLVALEFNRQERDLLKLENERLRELARNVRDNFDCDEDAHKYNTYCRKCEAKLALMPE